MSRRAKGGNAELLRIFDDDAVKLAITKVQAILNDPRSKASEVLNAADKIIKWRFAFQESIRKQAMDSIEIQYKQLNLEEKRMKVDELRISKGNPVNSQPDNSIKKTHSRVFAPIPSEQLREQEALVGGEDE